MVDNGLNPKSVLTGQDEGGFVEVVFAKSADEAIGCRDLLENRNIPARLEDGAKPDRHCGFAVLVPSDRLLEASELLVTRPQERDDLDDVPFVDDDDAEDVEGSYDDLSDEGDDDSDFDDDVDDL